MEKSKKSGSQNSKNATTKPNSSTNNRQDLGELENAVDEGKVEVVLVKDLSRLGRH